MMHPWIKIGIALATAFALFAFGWHQRGLKATADMASFQADLAASAKDQRDLKSRVEAAQTATTAQSTERLDNQAAEREKEVVYVDREVIQYRDRWRDSACRLPADWLRLYNRALGVGGAEPDGTVPDPANL